MSLVSGVSAAADFAFAGLAASWLLDPATVFCGEAFSSECRLCHKQATSATAGIKQHNSFRGMGTPFQLTGQKQMYADQLPIHITRAVNRSTVSATQLVSFVARFVEHAKLHGPRIVDSYCTFSRRGS